MGDKGVRSKQEKGRKEEKKETRRGGGGRWSFIEKKKIDSARPLVSNKLDHGGMVH